MTVLVTSSIVTDNWVSTRVLTHLAPLMQICGNRVQKPYMKALNWQIVCYFSEGKWKVVDGGGGCGGGGGGWVGGSKR